MAIATAAWWRSLAAWFGFPAAPSVTASSAWLEMVCPEPASMVPAACPVAMSPTKVARAVGPVGAVVVVVVVGEVVAAGGCVVESGLVEFLALDVA